MRRRFDWLCDLLWCITPSLPGKPKQVERATPAKRFVERGGGSHDFELRWPQPAEGRNGRELLRVAFDVGNQGDGSILEGGSQTS